VTEGFVALPGRADLRGQGTSSQSELGDDRHRVATVVSEPDVSLEIDGNREWCYLRIARSWSRPQRNVERAPGISSGYVRDRIVSAVGDPDVALRV
jgi:hypothetical protein